MAKETLTNIQYKEIFEMVPHLIRFPTKKMWMDYDDEADVLYISFQRPQNATDTEMTDEGVLLRYRGEKLVGLTILEASKREYNTKP